MNSINFNEPFVRFGFIPESERSNIYCGDVVIGRELGVSCYECIKVGDKYRIIYPPLNDRWDKTAKILNILIRRFLNGDTLCFLIEGDVVGRGTDNEPLLRNVNVIKELKLVDFIHNKRVL